MNPQTSPSTSSPAPIAVVTGASSGIGRAAARSLAASGYHVFCTARRTERITALAEEIGGTAVTVDVTKPADLTTLVSAITAHGGPVKVLVANAGGAIGLETVATANLDDWRTMYETNVLGVAASIQTLLPELISAHGSIITIGSIAGHTPYEGGAGYCGVKHAVRALMGSLRLELFDQPVRICEIDPGLVHSDEFSLVRFRGDAKKAAAVYEGVVDPLRQEDIAECITWVANQPEHVNIDSMIVKPRSQAGVHKLHRHKN